MPRSIFISYRRRDSEGEAGRLSDVLTNRFTEQSVFMDVDAIRPGRDFRKAIEESIQNCAVLLTVIGPDWLSATTADGTRRLDEPNDYVRLEIAAALAREIPIIPVLVRGAKVPLPHLLPPDITDLAYRNGVELTHSRWKSDLQILIQALEPFMATIAESATTAAQPIPPAKPASPTPTNPLPAIPADAVEVVSRRLAQFIGPIAELVVRRAALRSHSLEDLYDIVSKEIESQADRKKFLAGSSS